MPPLSIMNCCFCISLPQGFSIIIYLDCLHMIWSISYKKLKNLSLIGSFSLFTPLFLNIWNTAEYSMIICALGFCIYQMYTALRSFTHCLYNNEHKIIYNYLIAKIFYLFFESLRLVIGIRTFPYNFEEISNRIQLFIWLVEAIWILLDFYFIMVLLVIYKNARKGFSGIIFNRERHMEREILEKIPNALVLECKGLKIQKEGFFEQMKKKCRSLLRAFPKFPNIAISPISYSEENRVQNFLHLANKLEMYSSQSLECIYTKNVGLLKKNIKLSPQCPDLHEIKSIFNELYGLSLKFKYSNGNSPSYLFSKGKTLFLWILSVYELFYNISQENLKNQDWYQISLFLPNSDPNSLKCKWFRYVKQAATHFKWTPAEDNLLLKLMKDFYPSLFHSNVHHANNALKIKWSKISYELNKAAFISEDFKKDCQCRERWLNHLSPNLNRKDWTVEEDICLLEKASVQPKKWAKFAGNFQGRNQHSIKNRFILLITKEFDFKWNQTKEFMKRPDLQTLTKKALQSLLELKSQNMENESKNISELCSNEESPFSWDESFFMSPLY